MKLINQIIEETLLPDPKQLNLLPGVTLQIVIKPKINNIITLDKRFWFLSNQKRWVKEEDMVEDPNDKSRNDNDNKTEETVEQALPEWE